MNQKLRRVLVMILALVMFIGITPTSALVTNTVSAENLFGEWKSIVPISAIDTSYRKFSFSRPNNAAIAAGWYFEEHDGTPGYEIPLQGTGSFTVGNDSILTIAVNIWYFGDDTPTSEIGTYSFAFDGDKLILTNLNGHQAFSAIGIPVEFTRVLGTTESIDTNKPSVWAEADITRARGLGLLPSSLDGRYQQSITRAEFCAIAVTLYERVAGREITERLTFNDTTDINVQKMGALGVVTGVGGGNFAPNAFLTREQAATMLARLAEAVGNPLPRQTPTFADNALKSSWAIESVGQIQAAGIMGGTGNNMFSPRGQYTLEQSIITILRLNDYLAQIPNTVTPPPETTPPELEEPAKEPPAPTVRNVTITYGGREINDFTVRVGETIALRARIEPVGVEEVVEWFSSDTSVFDVVPTNALGTEAKVTGIGRGDATLTASVGGVEAECIVRIR